MQDVKAVATWSGERNGARRYLGARGLFAAALFAVTTSSAQVQLAKPDAQTEQLRSMAGSWDVVMTFRPSPGMVPQVATGIVAERTMIGDYLQEVMRPELAAGAADDFRRISYLVHNKTDSRWEYSSIDTRVRGVMTRSNFGNERGMEITFFMQSFALPMEFGGMAVARSVCAIK